MRRIAFGIVWTIVIAVLVRLFGAILGLPFAAARQFRFKPRSWIATAYIDLVRAIPPITCLFVV